MDYEKAYKDALERARIWKDKSGMPKDKQGILDDIFPELKENKEEWIEKLRKEIITFLGNKKVSCIDESDAINVWIAWLEKRSNQTIFNTPSRETILAIWELGNDWKELTNGVISTEHGTQLDYIQKHWSESEHYLRERRKQKPTSNEQQGKSALEVINEQKPNNKPKFNVGDWITNGYCTRQITFVDSRYWYSETGVLGNTIDIDKTFHLWTIRDAKDGDVLSNGKMIVIFKHFEEPSYRQHIVAYIGLDTNGDIQITDDTWNLGIDKAKPATKEQRDLLFQKMKERGYAWDSDKKEPIKIESQQAEIQKWSEEDEDNLTGTCVAIRKFYHGTNGAQELIDWLQSLKQKKNWKPSEEQVVALRWVLNNIQ